MEKKQVLLSVMGRSQGQDEEEDAMQLLTVGVLSGQGDTWRIDYTETQPDSESHEIVLIMSGGVVTMQRRGAFNTSMVFEKGCRFEGSYETPYGALDMGVYATHVYYRVNGKAEGDVNLQYQLDIQGNFAAMHELNIHFSPVGPA